MPKTLVSINRQIEKLQKEAATIKAKEVGAVIERIQTAIAFYGLTAADLFDAKPSAAPARKRKAKAASNAVPAKKEKVKSPIKYKDEAGNSWTGHGKRPAWFKTALESGKTVEDLLVKS